MRNPLQRAAHRLVHTAERAIDRLRYRRSARLWRDPWRIVPYRGYGSRERVLLRGRVLAGEGLGPPSEGLSSWQNLGRTLRRALSREVPGAEIEARLAGLSTRAWADDEGYFRLELDLPGGFCPEGLWQPVELAIVDHRASHPAASLGEVLVPSPTARFGIVSDVDDTVVQTGATSVVTMARSVLAQNAWTRPPFPGVAAFYRALVAGGSGAPENPIFYVSSSPWNLYDMLAELLVHRQIPGGPLLLRDLGVDRSKLLQSGHGDHKRVEIERILATYEELPFVLVGDSGQRDPEIYGDLVAAHPGRFPVVYIRMVHEGRGRQREVERLAARIAGQGTPMVLVDDTVTAARDAIARGLVEPAFLAGIEAEASGALAGAS